MPTPWFKFHSRFLCDARLLDIARETGLMELAVCGAYAVLLDAASQAKPRGKVPESAAAALARCMGNGSEDTAKPIVEAFRRHGIITRYGHIAGWSDDQIQPEKVEARKARKEAKAERQRAYRAKKAGKPVEVPAPEPKAEPRPEPEPAPKPKTVQLLLDGTPAEKPAPKAKKARAPKKPALSDERLKELFDVFWTAGGDDAQSPEGAWSWWKKAVHGEEQAARFTEAVGRAQRLQDAKGLSRFNVIKWLREKGYKAPVCEDEGAFQAELAKCAGRTERGTDGSARMSFKMMDLNAAADAFGVAAGASGYVDVEAFEVVRNDASPMRLPQAASAFINS